jgi:hypothetical protein
MCEKWFPQRVGDVSVRVGDGPSREGDVHPCLRWPPQRAGGASLSAGAACHELTCGSYEETWLSYDVGDKPLCDGDQPLRDWDAPLRVGDASLRAGDASHGLTGVSLPETCASPCAGGAWKRAGGVLFAR